MRKKTLKKLEKLAFMHDVHFGLDFEKGGKQKDFKELQIEHLTSVLNELEVVGDDLTQMIVKNAKERLEIDRIINDKLK